MSAHDLIESSGCGDFISSTNRDRRARIYDLVLNGSTPVFDAGVVGDAIQWPSTASLGLIYDGMPFSAFGTKSWTMRMWAKVSIPGTGYHYIGGVNGYNGYARLFAHYASDAPGSSNFIIRAYFGDLGSYIELEHPVEIPQADFHRFRMWYDNDLSEVGFQVNDEASLTSAVSASFPVGGEWGFQLGEGSGPSTLDDYYDEIGIWHDYLWTNTESEDDFNAGAGTGWPDVLDRVSRRPMLYWTMDESDSYTHDRELVPGPRTAFRDMAN